MKSSRILSEAEEKNKTKRLFLLMIISGLVCAMLGVGVLLYFFAPRDNDTFIFTVPAFVGKKEDELNELSGVDVTREWVYSSEVGKGTVISQAPYSGARRKIKNGESCRVTVYISLGEKTEAIPELSGIDEISAANALRSIGAQVRRVSLYGEGEEGCVILTRPASGTEIKPLDRVTIFVSRKRKIQSVTVPDFYGLTLAEAYRRALEIGLFVVNADELPLDETVKEQSIPEGAKVRRESYISFRTKHKDEEEREWPPILEDESDR